MAGRKRDNLNDLEKAVALPMPTVQSALKELGHMKSCWICDSSKWVVEALRGVATPIKFTGYDGGFTVAYQLTCRSCGHLRFADVHAVYQHITSNAAPVQPAD